MRQANQSPFTVRDHLDDLHDEARAAAAHGDWKENHRLCRKHDDLVMVDLRGSTANMSIGHE